MHSVISPLFLYFSCNPQDKSLEKTLEQALESAVESPATGRPAPTVDPLWAAQHGNARFQLIDISLDALFAGGTSTERDSSIQELQGGGHDPHKRGFTVQNVELSATGAVDPYFTGEAHIVYFINPDGESEVELEEAFLTTTSLPYDLQVEAGQSFTEFGRLNPQHPHQWEWIDQPVINTRMFGGDGMRGPGVRVAWLTPLPWFAELHLSVQNADGETMTSFVGEEGIDGRPIEERDVRSLQDMVYLVRLHQSWELSDETSMDFGLSSLFGPNSTGRNGDTQIYGADLRFKWKPIGNQRGWPFVSWQSEFIHRNYHADAAVDEGDPTDPLDDVSFANDRLRDCGLYTQILWGFKERWSCGLRYDRATAHGGSPDEDPLRDDRQRLSPLILYQPTEFSRLRLQYNYDRADHLDHDDAHSIWLGIEFMFGSHPAHKY